MSEAVQPVPAPEVPPLPEVPTRTLGQTLTSVVYWTLMLLGIGIPPLLGLYGTIF